MGISDKQVVHFHYTLKNEAGEVMETSKEHQPMAYLHGYGSIIPGLEAALAGRNRGDQFSVTIAPEDAYGHRQEDRVQRISVKHLHGASQWKPGMVAWVRTESGPQQVLILKAGKFMADVDFNHPLAGLTLTFDIEIIDVRDASEEELSHGHVHGEGGHHH